MGGRERACEEEREKEKGGEMRESLAHFLYYSLMYILFREL